MKPIIIYLVASTIITWASIYVATFYLPSNYHVQQVETKIERLQIAVEAMNETLEAVEVKCFKTTGVWP